ncbi:phytoene desaturase family protein [Microbacterium fluvii]|uniref:Phytoene desaturase family protein n=1 Tax=Microbacterium fluvii TaxID=415215 RepID=A0ABW2HB94_9MICO|nr:phytoene desaturase family protein [Microbacterium fluvii]MCU4672225.1 phytoene desaturase family protein [Microbacterium fluvii]
MRGPRTAVVVGGGIAGLASAALLARDGWDVTLVEKQPEVGGRAGSWSAGGYRFDTGPSWYLMPEVFDRFFRLCGTTAAAELDLTTLDPGYRVYAEGEPTPFDVPRGRDAAAALFEQRERGAGAALHDYLDSAAEAYALAVDRFLYDPYADTAGLRDRELLRRLPALAPLLTRSLQRHVASRFRDPLLRQILGYPAVFLGGSPSRVPALYHLMSHLDLEQGVQYPRGGFAEVIAAVARQAQLHGVRVRTGAEVESIAVRDGRARGVVLTGGEAIDADVVVSAADLHHTDTTLLPAGSRDRSERWWRRRTAAPGALLLLLGVRGELPELAHHTLLFTRDWRRNFDDIFAQPGRVPDPASMYVCRPSASDPDVAPPGHENLFVLVPIPADFGLGAGGVDGEGSAAAEAAADRAIAQLAQWTAVPDLAERIEVRRVITPTDLASDLHAWRGSALGLAHTLRQSAVMRPRNRARSVDCLFFAGGSALPGIGLPMCLISAELVSTLVRAELAGGRPAARMTAEA